MQPAITQPVVAPAEGTSADYGKYLVSILRCQECHGENLAGHRTGGVGFPAAPNLALLVSKWTAEEFIRTFRTGVDPYNHTIVAMPWRTISAFASDKDLKAMYAYLSSLTLIEVNTN